MLHVKELSEGGWQTEGKSKVKGQFDGAGKTSQRSRDCWSVRSRGKGKGEQKGKRGYAESEHGCKGGYHHNNRGCTGGGGGGKFVNVCGSQSFALPPQPVHQSPDEGNRCMTASWNGYAGNFGGTENFGGLNQPVLSQHEHVRSAS